MHTAARPGRWQRGFGLAELLVVCALLGVVAAGLAGLLLSGQDMYRWGTSQVDAQQAGRVAIERMVREVREAGYHPVPPTCPAPPCPPGFVYQFDAIAAPTAVSLTLLYDWNGDGVSQAAGTVTDPITGTVRGERVTYSFAAGTLSRQEIGVDGAPLPLAAGIQTLTLAYLDQNDTVTATPANIRTVTLTLTAKPVGQGGTRPWCTACGCATGEAGVGEEAVGDDAMD